MSQPEKTAAAEGATAAPPSEIDVRERGAPRDGEPQVLDRRLFMQLSVFRCPAARDAAETVRELGTALRAREVPAVIYDDVNDPRGIGVLCWSEDPARFVTAVRPALASRE